MGSSTKKKKRRKTEFQKVKLKVGRRLPKGNNITDASFKTRKIQIRNQEKLTANEVKLKHSLQELFNLLHHHNSSARQAALMELKEHLIQSPETIKNSLGSLIENIAELITDKSSIARKASIGLLRLVFKKVSSSQIMPFFPILSAYLCCAMTHITPEIQIDSLEFFDLLIEEFPEPLITSANNVLSNFLEQISYKQTLKCTSVTQRTIITNPQLKILGASWRVNVLNQLEKVLRAFLHFSPGISETKKSWISLCWDKRPLNYNPTFNMKGNFAEPMKILSGKQQTIMEMMMDIRFLQEFIKTVIPLLSETWIELNPSQDVSNLPEANVSHQTYDNLLVLMKIYQLFLSSIQLLKQEDNLQEPLMIWFQKNFEDDFINQFMKYFPYTPYDHNNKKKRKLDMTEESIELKCCSLNLAICDIFTSVASDITASNSLKWYLILEYINSSLKILKEKCNLLNLEVLIKVLKKVFLKKEFEDRTEDILRGIVNLYKDSNIDGELYNLLLNFLSELVLHPSFQHFKGSTSLTLWLTILPKYIIRGGKLSWRTAAVAHQLVSYNKEAFLHCLSSEIPNIIGFMANTGNCDEGKENFQVLIETIFWTPFLHKMDFVNLAKIVNYRRQSSSGIDNAVLIIKMVNQRYRKCLINNETAHYVSFIITIVLGCFWSELESIKPVADCKRLPIAMAVLNNCNRSLEMDFRIVQEAVNGINLLKFNVDKLKTIIFSSLGKLLDSCHAVPFSSSVSLLRFIYYLRQPNGYIDFTFANKLSQLTVATLDVYLNRISQNNDNSFHDIRVPAEYYAYLLSDMLDVILRLSKDIQEEPQALSCISMLNHLLQSDVVDHIDFSIFEKIMKILQIRFGEDLEGSIDWCSLQYDFSLRKSSCRSVIVT